MKQREPEYKPLLFTTTIRNPERIKFFLYVISKFEGKTLDNDVAKNIVSEAIRYGIYRPMKRTNEIKAKWSSTESGEFSEWLLNDDEVKYIITNNPQQHKEAGYSKGWASRFQTEFLFPKQLGLVYYAPNEVIHITELGQKLIDCFSVEVSQDGRISYNENKPENEQLVFIQAMGKYQRNNPLLKVLNANVPLILLLQVIEKLDANPLYLDHKGQTKGISRKELPLLIFWKDNDAEALYKRIVKLRTEYGYNPSNEVIGDICTNEIMDHDFKRFKLKSIIDEYPDEFIRKMRITGLISLRGAGRFIDINALERNKVDYVLSHYAQYPTFTDAKKYFDYVSNVDTELFGLEIVKAPASKIEALLPQWLEVYSWEKISLELSLLSRKSSSKDGVLRFIPEPARLEFLTALSIKSKFPWVRVIPNYSCDDTGLPTSTAGGNQGDIECFEENKGILVEVTMAQGRTQTIMEIWPITRHLQSFTEEHKCDSQCIFIAPSIFTDSKMQIDFANATMHLRIRPYAIDNFVLFLNEAQHLYLK